MFILGNDGSFARKIISELKLKNSGNIFESFIIRKNCNTALAIKEAISWIKNFETISSPIIFIGGETRKEEKMYLMNVLLPYNIFLEAEKNNVRFIYLSSLSVFGLPNSKIITFQSEMHPLDLYGKTKLALDNLLFTTNLKGVSAIFPGSIITPKRPNLLAKIHKFRDNSILSPFFKFVPIVGGISATTTQMIINEIYNQSMINADQPSQKIFCNDFIGLEYVSKYLHFLGVDAKVDSVKPLFKFKTFSLFFVKLLTILLPYQVRRRIIFFTIPIFYK